MPTGSLIAYEDGEAVTYGLFNAQDRGTLFIGPGEKVYAGMIIGENPRTEDIEDEHDEEEQLIRQNTDGSYTMSGFASLSDVAETLQIPVNDDDFDTLNGFLVSLMEKIPNDGETARLQAYGYEFSIRKVKDKMIREVLVKKADAKHQRPEDDPLARNGKE